MRYEQIKTALEISDDALTEALYVLTCRIPLLKRSKKSKVNSKNKLIDRNRNLTKMKS